MDSATQENWRFTPGKPPRTPKSFNPQNAAAPRAHCPIAQASNSLEITESLKANYPELKVAPRTVRENLHKLGYRVCIPTTVPLLTEAAKARRLSWAKSHLEVSWGKTVFSDETSFQMFTNT